MAANDTLTQFVREALTAGNSRDHIRAALTDAGWTSGEITDAMAAFAETDFVPPVPRPRPQLSARDAFIYLLLFTSLAFVASYLVNLIHSILDLSITDPGDTSPQAGRADYRIRWAIAVLLVSTPVFVWMTRLTRRQIAEDASHRRSLVRKWLTYLALFLSAFIFLGDATFVIFNFLKGEATLRFLLKAATVGLVSGIIFAYYLTDIEAGPDE